MGAEAVSQCAEEMSTVRGSEFLVLSSCSVRGSSAGFGSGFGSGFTVPGSWFTVHGQLDHNTMGATSENRPERDYARTKWEDLAWSTTGLFAVFSFWGWSFHFEVGPSHGDGALLGVVAGVVALLCATVALLCATVAWQLRRERKQRESGSE